MVPLTSLSSELLNESSGVLRQNTFRYRIESLWIIFSWMNWTGSATRVSSRFISSIVKRWTLRKMKKFIEFRVMIDGEVRSKGLLKRDPKNYSMCFLSSYSAWGNKDRTFFEGNSIIYGTLLAKLQYFEKFESISR